MSCLESHISLIHRLPKVLLLVWLFHPLLSHEIPSLRLAFSSWQHPLLLILHLSLQEPLDLRVRSEISEVFFEDSSQFCLRLRSWIVMLHKLIVLNPVPNHLLLLGVNLVHNVRFLLAVGHQEEELSRGHVVLLLTFLVLLRRLS